MIKFLESLFDSNEKQLNKIQPLVEKINEYEEEMSKLSEEELRGKTEEFRKKIFVDLETCRTDFITKKESILKEELDKEKRRL